MGMKITKTILYFAKDKRYANTKSKSLNFFKKNGRKKNGNNTKENVKKYTAENELSVKTK